MRQLVGFRSSLTDPPSDRVKGAALAEVLAGALPNHGYTVTATDLHRDSIHSIDLTRDGKQVWLMVGWIGLPHCDWQLAVPTRVGCLGRFKGADDTPERRELARAIHAVLSSDNRIEDVRWYETFSNDPDHPWFPEPA